VIAPAGPLRGKVARDGDRLVVTLPEGDDRTVEVKWPDFDSTPLKELRRRGRGRSRSSRRWRSSSCTPGLQARERRRPGRGAHRRRRLEQLVAGEKVTKAQLLRSKRLMKALVVVADHLEGLARSAGVLITGDLRGVIATAGAAQASVIDSQLPPGQDLVALDSWSQVSDRAIDAIVKRSTQQITSTLRPLSRQTHDVVRRELIRGIAAGSNPKVTARRMVQRAEKGFNGKLGLSRALNVARTETLDAHRAGAALGMSQHADVLRGWEWLAAMDERTCPSCWAQHGTIHTLDEPGPNDHPMGRCARNVLTKSWSDLGFDIPEPPSVTPDAQTVFDGLTVEQQKTVLGPARYEAYAAGHYPMGSWSMVKKNPDWRDSHVVTPVPADYRGGRSSRSAA
jgi:SPP1 gp7 family putative phage head morphogenesis protein